MENRSHFLILFLRISRANPLGIILRDLPVLRGPRHWFQITVASCSPDTSNHCLWDTSYTSPCLSMNLIYIGVASTLKKLLEIMLRYSSQRFPSFSQVISPSLERWLRFWFEMVKNHLKALILRATWAVTVSTIAFTKPFPFFGSCNWYSQKILIFL